MSQPCNGNAPVTTTTGWYSLLKLIATNASWYLRLYTSISGSNTRCPCDQNVTADFTQPTSVTFPGYTNNGVLIAWNSAPVLQSSVTPNGSPCCYVLQSVPQTFTATNTANTAIAGWYVVDNANSNNVVMAQQFSKIYTIANTNDFVPAIGIMFGQPCCCTCGQNPCCC